MYALMLSISINHAYAIIGENLVWEDLQMARPKQEKVAETRTVRMISEDWEALEKRAKDLGFKGRAELMRAIARGEVIGKDSKVTSLGESVPG